MYLCCLDLALVLEDVLNSEISFSRIRTSTLVLDLKLYDLLTQAKTLKYCLRGKFYNYKDDGKIIT